VKVPSNVRPLAPDDGVHPQTLPSIGSVLVPDWPLGNARTKPASALTSLVWGWLRGKNELSVLPATSSWNQPFFPIQMVRGAVPPGDWVKWVAKAG
jgi:hypothetical protein